MSTIYEVTRRDFLRTAGVGTGALVLGFSISPKVFAASITDLFTTGFPVEGVPFVAIKLNGDITIVTHRAEMGQGIRSSLAAVLADEMEADWDRVTLKQADADSHSFGIEYPYHAPDKPKQYIVEGDVAQFTDSSRSMAAYYQPMRLFGAAVRLVMIRAASKRFGVPVEECVARQHKVYHEKTGRSVDYGRLLLRARKEGKNPPTYEEITAALKPQSEWYFIRDAKKKMPFVDAPDMVTGKTQFTGDIQMRGMLTAMVERCPVANGRVKSYDDTETRKVKGVVDVMEIELKAPLKGGVGAAFMPYAGVAVLAKNTWAAWQGRRKLKVEWDLDSEPAKTNATYDSDAYRKQLVESTSGRGKQVRNRGDVYASFDGTKIVEANYYIPHMVQTPMEPPVAVAVFDGERLEVWAPTQNPDSAQQMAGVAAFGIPWERWELESTKELLRKKVTVHMPLLGGGFGRKSKPDYVAEAAFLASKKPGTPIRVQWTREDDVKFSYYNAVSNQYLKAGLGPDGRPRALLQRSAFPSIFATLFPPNSEQFAGSIKDGPVWAKKRAAFHDGGDYPYGSGVERAQGLEDNPFDVPNLRIENCEAHNHIRVGWVRSVANLYHAFAVGSFADEMAKAAGRDSKDYLLELIGKGDILRLEREGVVHFNNNEFPVEQIPVVTPGGKSLSVVPGYPPDTSRLRDVVEKVAAMSGWDAKKGKLPKGRGLGIAAHRSFLTYVALVFDVSLSGENELTINEVFAAVDCGLVVNPDRVKAQIEGGINYGLSMALLGEITVKKGEVVQNNFDDYPVLRIHQTPKNMVIAHIEGDRAPTGVGEPPTPVVAPALANAIVAAGGPRIREMPFFRFVKVV